MTTNKLPTRQLGKNGPHVSAIGFGTMGIGAFYGSTDIDQAYKALTYAADRGVTFWDTSDLYGNSEEVLGKWFKETGRRKEIFLATKYGAIDYTPGAPNPHKPNSKPSYIRRQFQHSLDTLQTDYIDLYYQHRVDPEVPIEVVLETLKEFVDKGQLKWIGLSECHIDVLKRAKAVPGIGDKVIAVQMEYSLVELFIEHTGFLQTARDLGVGVVAYSPLCRGLLSGRFRSRADFDPQDSRLNENLFPRFSEVNFPKNVALVDKIKVIADKLGVNSSSVALAWILAENPDIVPIPGTRNVDRLEENAKGAEIKLSPEDVKEIRRLATEADIAGDRYSESVAAYTNLNCIPVDEWKGEP